MIDLHSHILPGLDDGAELSEDALAMARAAVADGIRIAAATPHHNNGKYANKAADIIAHVQQFNRLLAESQIPLTVVPGQEMRVNDLFWGELGKGHILPLNQSRYILIELPTATIPRDIAETIHELLTAGYVPIIAHPERNLVIAGDPDRLEELVALGALSQITTHSLCGIFGRKLQKLSLKLCRRNLVHILASDAHDTTRRPFHMREAYALVRRELGEAYEVAYMNNAEAVLKDVPIRIPPVVSEPGRSLMWWRRKPR